MTNTKQIIQPVDLGVDEETTSKAVAALEAIDEQLKSEEKRLLVLIEDYQKQVFWIRGLHNRIWSSWDSLKNGMDVSGWGNDWRRIRGF